MDVFKILKRFENVYIIFFYSRKIAELEDAK